VTAPPTGPRTRVRVTGPRTGRRRPTTVAAEIDARTELGAVYMRSLVRSQLRLALGVVLVLAATLGAVPLALALAPSLGRLDLLGVPVVWLVLGALAYPFLVVLAVGYVRRAERNEAAFRDLLGGREGVGRDGGKGGAR
jgi:hypothetical protein